MEKYWEVKRVVVEYYQVKAKTRQEAKDNCMDPVSVEGRSETARLMDTSPVRGGRSIF